MASSPDSPSNTLTEHLSDVARRELSALQTALDLRLSRLDAVLADPGRVESLESLVIDLARVATQEAHMAAAVACLDAKRDADARVAQFRTSTQDGIERDRAAIAELRQAVEQAQQQIAGLERKQDAERMSLQEQFDHALSRERSSAADAERALEDAHQKVQRASSTELRRSAARVSELQATLEREQADAREAQGALSAKLAAARDEVAERERARAETASRLDAELASAATLREQLARADSELSATVTERALAQSSAQELTRELAGARDAIRQGARAVRDTEAELDTERARSTELHAQLAQTQTDLSAMTREHALAQSSAQELTSELAGARDAIRQGARALGDTEAELDTARARITDLDAQLAQTQTDLSAMTRERALARTSAGELTAEIARVREAASLGARELVDTESRLDEERGNSARLRQELERAQAEIAAIARERGLSQASDRELTVELARIGKAMAGKERELAEAQSQLDTERASLTELRHELARTEAEKVSIAQDRAFVQASADELNGTLARAREDIAGEQRALADTQSHLDGERARGAELGQALEQAKAELARDRMLSQASDRDVTVELGHVREALAEMQRVVASTQAQLDAERSATMTLRQQLERAREDGETIIQERVFAQATADELTAELARAHEITAARERALADTQSQLDAEHLCSAELNQELERVESELAAATREQAVGQESDRGLANELVLARRALAETQAALDLERASHAEPRGPMERLELRVARDAEEPASTPRRTARGREKEGSSAEHVEAGRPPFPVNRHAFREPIDVMINGEGGMLFDLSATGCQIQSTSMLKPNHGVRIVLTAGSTRIACKGKVVWARLELPAAGRPLGYRAGVEFTKPDTAAIEAFVAHHTAETTKPSSEPAARKR